MIEPAWPSWPSPRLSQDPNCRFHKRHNPLPSAPNSTATLATGYGTTPTACCSFLPLTASRAHTVSGSSATELTGTLSARRMRCAAASGTPHTGQIAADQHPGGRRIPQTPGQPLWHRDRHRHGRNQGLGCLRPYPDQSVSQSDAQSFQRRLCTIVPKAHQYPSIRVELLLVVLPQTAMLANVMNIVCGHNSSRQVFSGCRRPSLPSPSAAHPVEDA